MTETRYVEVYDNEGNVVAREPYEVSGEELKEEADRATAEEYLGRSPEVIKLPEIWWLLRYFAKQLHLRVEEKERTHD